MAFKLNSDIFINNEELDSENKLPKFTIKCPDLPEQVTDARYAAE
jgi:hypothetical protein